MTILAQLVNGPGIAMGVDCFGSENKNIQQAGFPDGHPL
jgi:hypothetical protein